MLFEAAEKKLKRIAKGRYCSLRYERTYDDNKTLRQECGLYIDGMAWYTLRTWKQAFEKLQEVIEPAPVPKDEAPTEEVDNDNHD